MTAAHSLIAFLMAGVLALFTALAMEPSQDLDHPPKPAPRAGVMEDAGEAGPGSNLEGIGVAVERIGRYVAAVEAADAAELARAARYVEAVDAAERAAEHAAEHAAAEIAAAVGSEIQAPAFQPAIPPTVSAGWAIPTYLVMRESGGDYSARNPSGACGAYQVIPSTWNGYGGYSSACDAPSSVQDKFAGQLWDGGAGCSHWSAC